MTKELKEFWAGRARYSECDFCQQKKPSRGIGPEVDVMSQCWDCHASQTYPVSLEAILFREVQEYLKEEEEEDDHDGRHGASCSRCCP